MTEQRYTVFETDGGFCAIAWNDAGITRFQLPANSEISTENLILRRVAGARKSPPPAEMQQVIGLVKRYFAGERVDFSDIRLDLTGQDDFFRNIYTAARRVGWGHTTTYGTIARELGFGPEKARDIGQAMARNPVALIIPCHRILAAGGKIGGFSAPGGSVSKARMLVLEGVGLAPVEPVQQSLF
jgi:methylated-DNA-[protein]-cysteine S-methyltransferase